MEEKGKKADRAVPGAVVMKTVLNGSMTIKLKYMYEIYIPKTP